MAPSESSPSESTPGGAREEFSRAILELQRLAITNMMDEGRLEAEAVVSRTSCDAGSCNPPKLEEVVE
jgi:urocanate hydratase